MQTNYNEVVVLQQGGDVLMKQISEQINIHIREREISGEMKRLKRKMKFK